MSLLKEFRVRLNQEEVETLLEAIDSCCRQLVKQHLLNEDARQDFYRQCSFDADRNPQPAAKWNSLCEERSSIEAKIRRLENLETEFQALLKGKRCGRRPRTPPLQERLWNYGLTSKVHEEICRERLLEKLLKEAEASGRTATVKPS